MTMWIIPKSLPISPSVPATEGSTLDYDAASQACGRSLMRRSKPSQSSFFSREWKAGRLTRLRYGVMSGLSLGESFAAKWIYYLEATHVSHFPKLEGEWGKTTQDICGLGSQTAFPFSGQESASLKTSQDMLPWGCATFCKTWESWVTDRRGGYSARKKLGLRTRERGSLSWPTITAMEGLDQGTNWECLARLDKGGRILRRIASLSLGRAVPEKSNGPGNRPASWATPIAGDWKGQVPSKGEPRMLSGIVEKEAKKVWATPIVGDSHLLSTPEVAAKRLDEGKVTLSRQNPGKLNPRWVEVLMGLPIGWVMPSCTHPATTVQMNCGSSETELSPPQQKELF